MDFAVMGTVSAYVKQKNLTFAAKHKIQTGQVLTNANGNLLSMNTATFNKLRDVSKIAADKAKQMKLRRIKNKLLNGKKLSEEEMGFLRVNDPKTYKKAKNAQEAREELKAELKKAKSKDEAREAMSRAMIKASSEAMAELGALGQGGGISSGGGAAMQTDGGTPMQAGGDSPIQTGSGDLFSSSDAQTQSTNEAAQVTGDNESKGEANNTQTGRTQGKADDSNTPEDIMEKYIMTIRALEDEWANFTNSDEYKDLPEHTVNDVKATVEKKKIRKQITAPDRRFLAAAAVYRNTMLNALD